VATITLSVLERRNVCNAVQSNPEIHKRWTVFTDRSKSQINTAIRSRQVRALPAADRVVSVIGVTQWHPIEHLATTLNNRTHLTSIVFASAMCRPNMITYISAHHHVPLRILERPS